MVNQIDKREKEEIIRLVREGKIISKIWKEDFPYLDYWDIYWTVYEAGEKSSLSTKRMITNRLRKITSATKTEQQKMVDEIGDLVWDLYLKYKESQKKLEEIRSVINR